MGDLIHSSYYRPRIFPIFGNVDPAEVDRIQSLDPTVTQNREKVEEVGNPNVVGYLKKIPTIGYRLTQLEYGNVEFWRKLANKEDSVTSIDLDDFKTPAFDICAYLTDDADNFLGTAYYPNLRLSGFSFTIGDPEAKAERGFDFVGESLKILQNDNKYLIYGKHTAGSGNDDEIDLSAKEPTENPNVVSTYMFRVVRVRGSVSTELTRTTDYSYSAGTKILTIVSIQTGDVIKYWYSSSTAPDVQFTPNTVDPVGILADSVSIYLYIPASGKPESTDYAYRLQSVSLDVSLEREDIKEIGNRNVVKRGVNDKTVGVTLGRILERFTIEDILAEKAGENWGILDVANFTDQATLIIKVYEDYTKANFKFQMTITDLSSEELRGGASVNTYVSKENALTSENLTISTVETVI